MIGFFLAAGDLDASRLAQAFRRRIEGNVRRSLDKRLSPTDRAVAEWTKNARDLETYLLHVGLEFIDPPGAGLALGKTTADHFPSTGHFAGHVHRAYSRDAAQLTLWTIQAAELPSIRAEWATFRRAWELNIERLLNGRQLEGFPPPPGISPEAYRATFSPVTIPPGRDLWKAVDTYRLWVLPVDAALSVAQAHNRGFVFRWERMKTALGEELVLCALGPVDLDAISTALEKRDTSLYAAARERMVRKEVELQLGPLGKHECLAWLLSNKTSSKNQAVFDEPETEAAAWYLLSSAHIDSVLEREFAIDASMQLGEREVGALQDAITRFAPALPNPKILGHVDEYWGGAPELPWSEIAEAAASSVIPSLRRLFTNGSASPPPLVVVRCNKYDELW